MFSTPSRPNRQWSDQRILILVALGTLIVSVIWRLPEALGYLGARLGEILVALTLSMAMAYVLRPIVRQVARYTGDTPRGRSLATLITFLALVVGIYVVSRIGFGPIQRDVRTFMVSFAPNDEVHRAALMEQWRLLLLGAIQPYRAFLPRDLFSDPNYIPAQLANLLPAVRVWLGHQSSHLGFVVELLLVPVLAFYFLADGPAIRHEARLLFPKAWRPRLSRMGEHFDYVLDGYVRGQVWMCIIAWVLVTLTLWVLGVPHAITLGLIAGLTRAIPVIGPLLGAIPLLLVCLFFTKNMQTTMLLLGGFTLMHFLESKVLLPKIVGHHVDLHPVSVIVAILLGMEFFGAMGVLLAVPIAAVLKIVLAEYHAAQEQKAADEEARLLSFRRGPRRVPSSSNGNGHHTSIESAPIKSSETPVS